MKIIDGLKNGYEILKKGRISSYKIDCEILMSQTLNISREKVLLNLEKNIKKEEKEKYFNLVNRRKKNEPVAYIINIKNFWKDEFLINKDVLIPRPDSEHLVEEALRLINRNQAKRILDVGVGSGCLSISILKERPYCKCDAIDLSKNALKLAKINAKQNKINNCKFYTGDMKEIFTDDFILKNGKPSVIIADPPRDGMHKKVIEQILKIKPIIDYVISIGKYTQSVKFIMHELGFCNEICRFPYLKLTTEEKKKVRKLIKIVL